MKKKICFVGLDNYPVLNPHKGGEYFGGESVQQTLLAKAFAESGFDVSMVVSDHGQPQGEVIDGIRVWKTFRQNAGIRIVRFIYPRITSILSALNKADADIYYQSCAGMMTGLVAWFCKLRQRQFLFRVAHDSDCIPGEQIIRFWRDRKLYEYGLSRAAPIAAQGVNQVALLKEHYGLDSTPINMVVEMPQSLSAVERDLDILWVNNLRDFKRPDLVVELAKLLPGIKITMIGGAVPGNEILFDAIKAQADELPNLEFCGAISYHEVNDYFSRAKLFVNTSDWEGFPNSFLQAWAREVPVISFFDPDGLIGKMELGDAPDTIGSMADTIKGYLSNEDRRIRVAKRCRSYAIENYSPGAMVKEYIKMLGV